tara:strand:+ start:1165 stop:1356 length:192 start_codon:yes stop_codon:yes gene_type:complete
LIIEGTVKLDFGDRVVVVEHPPKTTPKAARMKKLNILNLTGLCYQNYSLAARASELSKGDMII